MINIGMGPINNKEMHIGLYSMQRTLYAFRVFWILRARVHAVYFALFWMMFERVGINENCNERLSRWARGMVRS